MKSPKGAVSDPQNVDELIANISQPTAEAEEMLSESHPPIVSESELRRRWQSRGARLLANYNAAKARLAAAARSTDDAIRHYPYESVVIALGVGVGLGAWLFGRRR